MGSEIMKLTIKIARNAPKIVNFMTDGKWILVACFIVKFVIFCFFKNISDQVFLI